MSDAVIGFVGRDYVLIAADTAAARSIVVFKSNEDKILQLDDHKVMGMAGPNGDRTAFGEYIQRNVQLYEFRNNIRMSTHATANFARNELAEALRRGPYQVNLLLGGFDEGKGPSLYYMDYLASMMQVDKAAHGYASFFVFSILDRLHSKNMDLEQGLELLRKCIGEVKLRFLINTQDFIVKVVDKTGVRQVKL